MTPQEKAKELVCKYLEPNGIVFGLDIAKQCALIAVDEILSAIGFSVMDEYWIEVKQEIEKL